MSDDYYRAWAVLPLDADILEKLPKQGEVVARQPIAATAKHLAATMGGVTSAQLNGRLRRLKMAGCAIDLAVLPLSDGRGWQITPHGEETLAAMRADQ